jgi:hypothetical protein
MALSSNPSTTLKKKKEKDQGSKGDVLLGDLHHNTRVLNDSLFFIEGADSTD